MGRTHSLLIIASLTVAVLLRLYAIHMPITYDEAYTYLHFIKSDFLYCITNYHVANNHFLFSILGKICVIFFGEATWVIRLPSIISGIAIIPLSYLFWKKVGGNHVALLTTTFVATSFSMAFYSGQARGYSLQAFLFILSFIFGKLIINQSGRHNYLFLSLTVSFGLYTVPSMLYGAGAVYMWIFGTGLLEKDVILKEYLLTRSTISVVLTSIFTIIFYSPVLFSYKGLPPLKQATKHSFSELLTMIPHAFDKVIHGWNNELQSYVVILATIGLFALVIRLFRNSSELVILLVSIISWPTIVILLTGVIPPFQRVWIYFLPFYFGMISLGIIWLLSNPFFSKKKIFEFIPLIIVISVLILNTGNTFHRLHSKISRSTNNANLIYKTLNTMVHNGDIVASHLRLGERLMYLWNLDDVHYKIINKQWTCSVIQIKQTPDIKFQPITEKGKKVFLVTMKDRNEKDLISWLKKQLPSKFSVIRKESTSIGESKIISIEFAPSIDSTHNDITTIMPDLHKAL